MKSIIYLNKETLYTVGGEPQIRFNGKPLHCAPISISLEDKFLMYENAIEKRIIDALSNTGRTYYHAIWDTVGDKSMVYYIKRSKE